jgi:hypothetical protein
MEKIIERNVPIAEENVTLWPKRKKRKPANA